MRNKHPVHKSYRDLPVIPLPVGFTPPEAPTLEAVAAARPAGEKSLDLMALAQLLFFAAGLVRKRVFPEAGEANFRAAASAGALYPVEVYLACGDIPSLQAGVYHCSPADFSLRQLREGNYRVALSQAAGGYQAISTAPVTLIFTAIFWRSAWKYRVRSYRYCFWDNGTIVANLLATASAAGLPARVVAGFVDDRVNRLLGIRGEREASMCLMPIGEIEDGQPTSSPSEIAPLVAETLHMPSEEVDYPEIGYIHAASSLATQEEVTAWRGVMAPEPVQAWGTFYPLEAPGKTGGDSTKLGEVILKRGSTRRFAPEPISHAQFSAILDHSTRGIPADFLAPDGASLLDIYMILNAVDGLPSGAYYFSPHRRGLELLSDGSCRAEAGHLCFEQALGADASAVVFFMADLGRVLKRYGNRGYRAAQLEAGILGGKMYLCAHSLGLGATGLTFYDDEVTGFFSPHAEGKSAIFVVALGVMARRNQVRPFRSRVGMILDALARGGVKKQK